MNNYDSSITGIVIDQYPSVAEVVKIMRKYTKDSIRERIMALCSDTG